MSDQERERKYTSVVLDTLNQVQNDQYVSMLNSAGTLDRDEWRDFGVDIMLLFKHFRERGAVIILVLGAEGTGKTVGGKFLDPTETVWLNADRKPLSFFGAKSKYNKENKNYSEPASYKEVKSSFDKIHAKRKHERLVVFVLAHTDVYKGAGETGNRERLRVLGKMATKLNIEGSVVHCYYTHINANEQIPEKRYRLLTQNTGYNTGRSPEGYFQKPDGTAEIDIPNNYQLIINKIIEDSGLE